MKDSDILTQINGLIDEEHDLRRRLATGALSSAEENDRVRQIEEALDQCWDLLRQRRARREAGDDPEIAKARPVTQVENYQQ